MSISPRKHTIGVDVGGVMVGGGAPIVVQSMTNTDTADIEATVRQVGQLWRAGSELVRITVDRDESAAAVPHIRDRLRARGINLPLIGDFHYIGHKLLTDHPACAEALAKYRINPGNVGFKAKRDTQFATLIELAIRYGKPVRIGVNWGSLDEELLTRLMDENAASPNPVSAAAVQREAIIQSALLSAKRAEEIGLGADRVVPTRRTPPGDKACTCTSRTRRSTTTTRRWRAARSTCASRRARSRTSACSRSSLA